MCATRFDNAIVTDMMEDAIEFCAKKKGLKDRKQALEAIRRGDCSICDYLCYSLAKGIAEYLGSVDDTVKTVYTYEPEYATSTDVAISSRSSSGINLIVWVSRKSAALSSVIASVRSALAKEYKQIVCSEANAPCYDVDVKVVDDDEVQRRAGYGALINSLYVRPIEIWQR